MGLQLPERLNVIARIDADAADNAMARAVIARPDDYSPTVVIRACEIVTLRPRDWIDFERARLLLAAVRLEEGVAA